MNTETLTAPSLQKRCSKCRVHRSVSYFAPDNRRPDRLGSWCRYCKSDNSRNWRQANPDKSKDKILKRKFGISLEEYNEMFSEQNGRCATCFKHQSEFSRALCVDHCHVTGKIRALLCASCNSLLGHFEKKPELFNAFASYVQKFKGN